MIYTKISPKLDNSRIGGHTIIVSPKFNGRGAAFSILEFLRFECGKLMFLIGAKFFLSYWA